MTENDHKKWAKIILHELVSHIENFDGGNKYITYGELAKKVNYPEPHTGNLFGSNIGKTLGVMGHFFDDLIIDGVAVPQIQAIAVSSGKKLPSDGLKEFNITYPALSTEKKQDYVRTEYENIFQFGERWQKVLNILGIKSSVSKLGGSHTLYNPYGSEGSPEHRALRDYTASTPTSIGLVNFDKGVTEYPLKSGDKVDVLFENNNSMICVEVKSKRSGFDDLERGLYQCIKYSAVMNAEMKIKKRNKSVQTILVIESKLPNQLKKISNQLSIKVIDEFEIE